jgi:membrane protein YqaA with SNARE-associated domain
VSAGTSPEPGPAPEPDAGGPHWTRLAIQLVLILALAALIVWANLYAADHELVREAAGRFGYAGILAAAALSGFNLVVPVPVVAFFPFFMAAGLAPLPTVLVIALGMTIGDLLGYVVGRTARQVLRPKAGGTVARLEALQARHPYLPLAVMLGWAAFIPAPNELLVIPLAFLRYPVAGIFVAVLVGNLVFNSLIAFGVVRIFETIQ